MELFKELSAGYGDLVRMDLAHRRAFLANHPIHIKRILQDNWRNYRLPALYAKARPVLGDGLLLSEGEKWAAHRKLMQPAFSHSRLAGLRNLFAEEAVILGETWAGRSGEARTLDVQAGLMRFSLRVVVRSLFGIAVEDGMIHRIGEAMQELAEEVNRRYFSLVDVPDYFPTARNRRFRAALSVVDGEVGRILREARTVGIGPGQGDLLGMLLSSRDEETGRGLDGREIKDEVLNLFIAGHETVTLGLSWLFHCLGRNPAIQESLRAEADRAASAPPEDKEAALILYARAAVQEALRLYPPVWNFAREAVASDALEPFLIPRGSLVFLCPYTMHRDPRFWEDPMRYDPGRFLGDREKTLPRQAYFPFGAGPRACIGQHFALMQMSTAVSELSRRFAFAPGPGTAPEIDAGITLRPRGGMPLRVTPR